MQSADLTKRGIIVFVGIKYPRCALALNSATCSERTHHQSFVSNNNFNRLGDYFS